MKGIIRKCALVASTLVVGGMLAACGNGSDSSGGSGDKGFVGIAMQTKSAERWIADGNNMVDE